MCNSLMVTRKENEKCVCVCVCVWMCVCVCVCLGFLLSVCVGMEGGWGGGFSQVKTAYSYFTSTPPSPSMARVDHLHPSLPSSSTLCVCVCADQSEFKVLVDQSEFKVADVIIQHSLCSDCTKLHPHTNFNEPVHVATKLQTCGVSLR